MKKTKQKPTVKQVMEDFKNGELLHSSGYVVTDKDQAKKIAKNIVKRAKKR